MHSQNKEETKIDEKTIENARILIKKVQFTEAQNILESIAEENKEKFKEKIPETLIELGNLLIRQGKFPLGRKYYHEALDLILASPEPEKAKLFDLYCLISEAYAKNAWWDKVLLYTDKALALAETELNKARVLNLIGRANSGRKYHYKALKSLHEAEEICLKIESEESTEIMSWVYLNLASAYHLRSMPERALEYYEHCLDLQKAVYGEFSPEYLQSRQLQALVKLQLGSTEEALKQSEETLQQRIKLYNGENHREVGESYSLIAPVFSMVKDKTKSFEYLEKALEIFEKFSGKESDDYSSAVQLSAILKQGDLEKAKLEELFDQAYNIKKGIFGEAHPITIEVLEDRSKTLFDIEKPESELFEKILNDKIAFWGENNSRVTESYVKLAESYIEDRKKYLELIGKAIGSFIGAIEADPFDAYESDGFLFLVMLSLQDAEIMKLIVEKKEKFQEAKKIIQKDMDYTYFARAKLKQALQNFEIPVKAIGEMCVLVGLI